MSVVYVPVNSSQIAEVGYDHDAHFGSGGEGWTLYVKFRSGGHYRYRAVSPATAARIVFTESPGKAFNCLVKGKFEFAKAEDAASDPEPPEGDDRPYCGECGRDLTFAGSVCDCEAVNP